MRLGILMNLPHRSPEEWAQKHKAVGLSSIVFPCEYDAPIAVIDAYVKVCKDYDLMIADVGAWKNLLCPDEREREANFDYCKHQLELADYVGARCCVSISGAKGEIWDGAYKDNYSEETYAEIIESVQGLIDSVKPKNTYYTLEPMPWMHPDSPEDYLQMIKDINRDTFAVHLDMVNMISTPQKYLFNDQFTNETISLLGKYIRSCHMKDVLLDTHLTVQLKEVPCGEGGFDIKNYIEQLDKLDRDIPVIIEHLKTEEEYLSAVKYIKTLGV